jgi:hypothetical protein
MSYLKNLTSNDVIVTPFTVNKSFTFEGASDFTSSQVGIDFLQGIPNVPSSTGILPTSSYIDNTRPQSDLVYDNIKHLYYSNYLSGSNGVTSPLATASFNPDGTITGEAYTPNYINSLQSPNEDLRNSLTNSMNVISIPNKLYGNYITPGSFYLSNSISTIQDDGEGNLVFSDYTSSLKGNIIYPDGMIIINYDNSFPAISQTWNSDISGLSPLLGNTSPFVFDILTYINYNQPSAFLDQSGSIYIKNISNFPLNIDGTIAMQIVPIGGSVNITLGFRSISDTPIISSSFTFTTVSSNKAFTGSFILAPGEVCKPYLSSSGGVVSIFASASLGFSGTYNYTPSELSSSLLNYSSNVTLYETQYKCTIRANEYNYSLNPSLLKSSSLNTYKDFVTGSDFSPYVTTIGLYNENQELLAVGKLAQPLPTSQTTDTTILINIDR